MTTSTLIILIVEAIWVAGIGTVIILQRRSAAATIAWVFALALMPIVGFIVYRLIGPLRLERKKVKRNISRKAVHEVLQAQAALVEESEEHQQLSRVGVELGECGAGTDGELFHDLDRGDVARELAQQRRGVARACSDFEHSVLRPHVELRQHERDHAGLADGLLVTDRQRAIGVGLPGLLGHEAVSRNA